MTRLAKPEKKAGKGNERREIYANRWGKAIRHKLLKLWMSPEADPELD